MRVRPPRGERGQSTILVAALLGVLLGAAALSIDVGRGVVEQGRLQNAADAAALAGATELPADPSVALSQAADYAALNGLQDPSITLADGGSAIAVQASASVPTLFARVLGILQMPVAVKAHAEALPPSCAGGACSAPSTPGGSGCASVVVAEASTCVTPATGQFGLAPWDVDQSEIEQYIGPSGCMAQGDCPVATLAVGAGSDTGGNFGPLAIGGSGASIYQQNIVDGAAVEIHVGDYLSTETGDIHGPTCDGVNQRLADGAPYIVVPVTTDVVVDGKTEIQVLGFAAFEVISCASANSVAQVTGRFCEAAVPGMTGPGTTSASALYELYGKSLLTA